MDTVREKITILLKHQFFAGSLIMVLGSNVYNLSQLVYHFLAGRFLGVANYGDLAALLSILGLLGIVHGSFGLTIVKFIASESNELRRNDFIKYMYFLNAGAGLLFGILVVMFARPISHFLNVSNIYYIYLLVPILLIFFVTSAGRNVFQGLLRFDKFVYSLLAESIGKILFTAVLLFFSLAVTGALLGFLAGLLMSFIITTFFLKDALKGAIGKIPNVMHLLKYTLATVGQGLALTSMYTVDLILVKHFFPSETAGLYAALAILGRIVFFGTAPITHVMFPIVARKHANGERYFKVLQLSIALICIVSLGVIGFYYFFPTLLLGLLYGQSYLAGGALLWWFALFMGILSIAMLLTQFYLSIGKTSVVYLFILAAILQALLIWFIHPDILAVIQLSIFSATLLVMCLFVYLLYLYKYSLR